ncbi:hypothetical protein ACH4OY_02495 [Micromonospora rubida]|uniref:PLL-like beta propeller domain-containing protein n=1 Tax=Micromonospora rubida TaxID=2697657 RepID=A0ABW7SCZ5_9ACTN
MIDQNRTEAAWSWPRAGWALLAAIVLVVVAAAVAVSPAGPARADEAGNGGDFVPLHPAVPVLDTRTGVGGVSTAPGPASTTTFPVLGVGAVPATGVRAVLVRVAVTTPSATTWLTVYPDGASRPSMVALNAKAGERVSNTAVVRVGANGRLAIYNNAGTTSIIVDVQGYFTTATGGSWGGLVPVAQSRVVDTRYGVGTSTGVIAPGASRTVNLATGGVPVGASAAFATVTVSGATANGWLTSQPAGSTVASPILDYQQSIPTASGLVLRLAADGRATLTNRGTTAIHLWIDVMAYFTPTATAGSGLRPVTGRIHDQQVAANTAVDVQVAGTSGLPLRGVAAVAVDLYARGTASGWLKAWTPGTTEPGVSQTQYPANISRRSLTFVKPDSAGRIRVRNSSGAEIRLVVELQGWFAEPAPVLPVTQFAPVAVVQDSPRTVQYGYVDNLGRVVSGHQASIDNYNSVQWTVISGNEAFTGTPAIGVRADGRTQLAAQYTDSDIWAASQTAPEAATWTGWSDLGGSMAAPPAMARLSTGVAVLFAVDVDGGLWAYAQTGAVPYWRSLGDQNLVGTPAVVAVRDGVQVFGRDSAGTVRTLQYYADGSVSAWAGVGGVTVTGTPAVVVYPGYRLRLFGQAPDGTVRTVLQDAAGGFPTTWEPVGDFVTKGQVAAILDPALGRTAVVARGTDDLIHRSWETAQGSGAFGGWAPAIEYLEETSATDPTVAPVTTANGQGWIIVFRNHNGSTRVYERQLAAVAGRSSPSGALAAGTPTFRAATLPAPPV